jgi:hypothetical protein
MTESQAAELLAKLDTLQASFDAFMTALELFEQMGGMLCSFAGIVVGIHLTRMFLLGGERGRGMLG